MLFQWLVFLFNVCVLKNIFKPGDIKQHQFRVEEEDLATFSKGPVHPVCSTFTLAREVEWASRLFVLELKDADEEGIGTFLEIQHEAPAFAGEVVIILATVDTIQNNSLTCSFLATVGERVIARGKTGQKVMKKEKIHNYFISLKDYGEG